ncbi:MAG: glycosyltransferase family 4 protein [Verrucomicrobiae bacterium]|nr:glycosyltransferase family 4 protein [Verrucomicrobiae bacterium]
MTVLQLVPSLESGGVERGTQEVANELVRRGHKSLVISGGGRMVSGLTKGGSEHITWPIGRKSPATFLLVPRLRRLIRERGVEIVHARSRMPAWIAWWAIQGTPAHFVTTVHGLYSVNAYSAIMTRGERVIVVSETVRQYILKNYRACDPARIRLVFNGIDPRAFPYGYRPAQFPIPVPQGKRILTLPGRITRLKGHEDFLQLLRGLPETVGLVVGGEDSRHIWYARQLRRRAPPNVIFTGHRDDMRDILAGSTIVFSLSRRPESFGRTTLEALSLGVPVIGYDHGGVGELLTKLLSEGRVPVGDLEGLSYRTRQFLAAKPFVPAQHPFQLEQTLRQTLAVYEELLRVSGDRG